MDFEAPRGLTQTNPQDGDCPAVAEELEKLLKEHEATKETIVEEELSEIGQQAENAEK